MPLAMAAEYQMAVATKVSQGQRERVIGCEERRLEGIKVF
jgi:hypothetical protein